VRHTPIWICLTIGCLLGLAANAAPPAPRASRVALQEALKIRDAIMAHTAPGAAPAKTALSGDDPCRLLSDAEVRRAFPGAASGKRNRDTDILDIATCEWALAPGRLAVQRMQGEPGSAQDWIDTMKMGIVNPLKAKPVIRSERIGGLGDEAVAMVELTDPKRGILHSIAVIAIRRGHQQVAVTTDSLDQHSRADALAVLTRLGRAAAARL